MPSLLLPQAGHISDLFEKETYRGSRDTQKRSPKNSSRSQSPRPSSPPAQQLQSPHAQQQPPSPRGQRAPSSPKLQRPTSERGLQSPSPRGHPPPSPRSQAAQPPLSGDKRPPPSPRGQQAAPASPRGQRPPPSPRGGQPPVPPLQSPRGKRRPPQASPRAKPTASASKLCADVKVAPLRIAIPTVPAATTQTPAAASATSAASAAVAAPAPAVALEAAPLVLHDTETDPIVLYARERAAKLQDAAAFGSGKTVEELCKSPRVHMYIDEQLGEAQATALMCAAQSGNVDGAQALLDARADVDCRDVHGRTALMFAAANGETSVVGRLLERGAHAGLKAENGWTALLFACACGHHETAGKLLEASFALRRAAATSPGGPGGSLTMEMQSALGLAKEHCQPGPVALLEALLDEEEPIEMELALMKAAEVWRAAGRTPRVEMTTEDPLPVTPRAAAMTPRAAAMTPRGAAVTPRAGTSAFSQSVSAEAIE